METGISSGSYEPDGYKASLNCTFFQEGNWEALDAIFTYHGQETLPHRLAILSNFDETLSPSEYRSLLPEAG